jgi:hypothetical protein
MHAETNEKHPEPTKYIWKMWNLMNDCVVDCYGHKGDSLFDVGNFSITSYFVMKNSVRVENKSLKSYDLLRPENKN